MATIHMNKLPRLLEDYLKDNNITLRALAEEIGINEAQLCEYLKGHRQPMLSNLRKIMEVIG